MLTGEALSGGLHINEGMRRQVTSILDDANDMTIATVRGDGHPQATTVSFVNVGLSIYFATEADSQKARNLTINSSVSLTVDRDYANWGEIEALSLSGTATVVTDTAEPQKVGALLFSKFPQIPNYASTGLAGVAIFRIKPQFVSLLNYTKEFGHTELAEI